MAKRLTFPTPLERLASGVFLGTIILIWAVIAGPFVLAKGLIDQLAGGERGLP